MEGYGGLFHPKLRISQGSQFDIWRGSTSELEILGFRMGTKKRERCSNNSDRAAISKGRGTSKGQKILEPEVLCCQWDLFHLFHSLSCTPGPVVIPCLPGASSLQPLPYRVIGRIANPATAGLLSFGQGTVRPQILRCTPIQSRGSKSKIIKDCQGRWTQITLREDGPPI